MDARGFTLVEMLLSISIIALLAGISLPLFQSFNTRNDLDISTQSLVSALRRAQIYSNGSNRDSQWGVAIQGNTAVLFKGAAFSSRDIPFDEVAQIASTTNVSGTSEIVFAEGTGRPSSAGTYTLTNTNNETRTVTINSKGMVSY